jgi:hypothetical protein
MKLDALKTKIKKLKTRTTLRGQLLDHTPHKPQLQANEW